MKVLNSTVLCLVALCILSNSANAGSRQKIPAQQSQPRMRCNPPPANLEYPAWYRKCEGILQARFRDSNHYGLPYTEFVRMVWQMYEVRYHPERHPALMGAACSPEGSGYMNQSGHAQICKGGRWQVYGQ